MKDHKEIHVWYDDTSDATNPKWVVSIETISEDDQPLWSDTVSSHDSEMDALQAAINFSKETGYHGTKFSKNDQPEFSTELRK